MPTPPPHYSFDGWYKATSNGSNKTGPKLADGTAINASIKLLANFEETEGEWFDLKFVSGPHGTIKGSRTINADQTYTARFIPIGISDDNILAMPDARGTVDSDGSGKVSVSGANENRRYALTDMDDRVVGTKLGSQLKNAGFTGLNPCTSYYVYKLNQSANPDIDAILPDHLDPNTFSPPSRVTVPALGTNYGGRSLGPGNTFNDYRTYTVGTEG